MGHPGKRKIVAGVGVLRLRFANNRRTCAQDDNLVAHEELLFIHVGGDSDVEEADHHLFVGLAAPADFYVGIGIMRVVLGVVVPRDGLEFGSGFKEARLGQAIAELPVKVVVVQAQQRLSAAIGMNDVVFEGLAAQVHVRKEAEERAVVGHGAPDIDAVVVGARRNDEGVIGELQRQHALLRRLLGEDHADAGLVGARFAVGGVVHLEDEVGAGGNELCHTFGPAVGLAAGSVNQQHIGSGLVRFGA